ncbi:MAG: VWA domain-containing protein, partial [Acidobacteriota bacterium]
MNRAGRGIYVWVVATLGAALLFAHTGFAAPLVSQENPPEQPAAGDAASQFFDAVDVDVANIDVMVTDRQGQPVTGLTADDFTIFIDDERVELTNFFEARGAIEGDLSIGASTDEPQAERGASRREPLHLVVVVDNRNIRPENRNRLTRRLRDALDELSFFDAVPSGRRLMVAELNRGLDVVVPFTSDRPVIAQALHGIEKNGSLNALLDSERRVFLNRLQSASLRHYNPRESKRFPGVHASTGGLQAFEDPAFDDAISLALKLANDVRHLAERRFQQAKSTTLALGDLCDTLGGMPGRKALLYVSDGLPLRPADSLFEAWSNKYQNWALHNQKDFDKSNYPDAGQTFSRIETALGSSEFDLRGELDQLTSRASTNRVAFYPISGSGRNSDLVSAAVSGGGVGGGAPHSTREAQHMENFTRDASLLQMADDTGGQALIRSTNLGELLQRLTRDFDTFYALGYPA